MHHNFIWWLNFLIFTFIAALALGTGYFHFDSGTLSQPPIMKKQQNLPQNPFAAKGYEMGTKSLQAPFKLPSLRVPDLRNLLKFHGNNDRPDAGREGTLFFSFGANSKDVFSVRSNTPQYLKIQDGGFFGLSPKNAPTDLWFEAAPQGTSASIQVFMKDEEGIITQEPREYSSFVLAEKPPPASTQGWQIDHLRVDGTLLVRQKAKWSGRDIFLEQHGDLDHMFVQGKQRVLFGEGENQYAVYVDKEDVLVWKEGKWQVINPKTNTENLPVMRITKIEERIMGMTLYSPKGDLKLNLNLLKTPDPLTQLTFSKDFRFLGARTRLHSMFQVNKKREIVGPEDWFLKTQEGWKKIKTAKEVDEFLKGHLKGPLFILDRVENDRERKWLSGTLYNASRSESLEIRLPLHIEEPPPKGQIKIQKEPNPEQQAPQAGPMAPQERRSNGDSLPPQRAPVVLPPES